MVTALVAQSGTLWSQHEYDVWQFGANYGLDFRNAPPTPLAASIWQLEGCASICNRRSGAPLFYTDGVTIWDGTDAPMPNGTGLFGHYSSTQSALIVPVPCDTNRYYVFTADHQGYFEPPRGIHYSIVDMRLNGGRGDVATKNIPVQDTASERLVAVAHANGRDYWVVTHSAAGGTFYAWLVSGAGVAATPVISVAGIDQGVSNSDGRYTYGFLKASPNGRKLASTSLHWNRAELFDFDPGTGRVTNSKLLYEGPIRGTPGTGPDYCYGITFSPDNTRLYQGLDRDLIQYDLTLPTEIAIRGSRTRILSSPGTAPGINGALQIGPDGRIYTMNNDIFNTWVGCIANPNVIGQGCSYTADWKQFTWSAREPLGLPNNIDALYSYVPGTPNSITVTGPNPHCKGDSLFLTAPSGYRTYEWSTGARTESIRVDSTGTYSLIMTDSLGCLVRVATQIVVPDPPTPTIIPLTPIVACEGDEIRLQVDSIYPGYRWSDGSTARDVVVRVGGLWSVTVTDSNGCRGTDTLRVTIIPAPRPTIIGSRRICLGDTTILDPGPGFLRYLWSTGDTTRTIQVSAEGNYTVTVRDSTGCNGTASMFVTVVTALRPIVRGAGSICFGDSTTLDPGPGFARYLWSTGDSTRTIRVTGSGNYSVTVWDSTGCSGVSPVASVIMKDSIIPHLSPTGTIELCEGDSVRISTDPGYARYLWSNGGSGESILTGDSGTYSVTAYDAEGCFGVSGTVRVIVHKRPPTPTVSLAGDTLVASSSPNYTWRYNGGLVPNGTVQRIRSMGPGVYTVTTVDSNGCASPSAPYRILVAHVVWLDTASARVGERVWLTMHVAPPVEAREMVTSYRFNLAVDPTSLFVHGLLDPPGMAVGTTRPTLNVGRDGSILVERVGNDPISGSELFRIEVEGLSTGVPINVVPILSLLFPESDSMWVAGDGLVVLSGCDVSHGFRFGKKVRIDRVVPNPARDGGIVVSYHAPEGTRPILTVIDAVGRDVVRYELSTGTGEQQEWQLDPTLFSSGFYRLQIRDRGEQSVVPLIVIR